MIVEINKENLDLLDNSTLLVKEEAEKELSINPFGKYLVLIENNLIIGFIYYSDIYERAEINQFEIEKVDHIIKSKSINHISNCTRRNGNKASS